MTGPLPQPSQALLPGHPRWVRACHWLVFLSFLPLVFTGYVILMCHPRLYWGEAGNDLTPPLLELPLGPNRRPGVWVVNGPFARGPADAVSASRTSEIFNENSWGRSLHFLAAWFLVVPGTAYLLAGIFTGHFRRHLLPRAGELTRRLWQESITFGCGSDPRPADPSTDRFRNSRTAGSSSWRCRWPC